MQHIFLLSDMQVTFVSPPINHSSFTGRYVGVFSSHSCISYNLLCSPRRYVHVPTAQFSSFFPQPDPFAFPLIAFPVLSAPDIRPELLGALLWSFGLYFGFSQQVRWAKALRKLLFTAFSAASIPGANFLADALHSFPFLAAGVLIDATLRYTTGGNAVWAVATGTSVALYAGVYELARQSNATANRITNDDAVPFVAFQDFARRSLRPSGMCHFIDVRAAIRRDSKAGALRSVSDETLRRFVRNTFPAAKRSPNGYYRGLSIRTDTITTKIQTTNASSSSPSEKSQSGSNSPSPPPDTASHS